MSNDSRPDTLAFDRTQNFSSLWHRPHPGPFNFLGLPTDIRILIYEEAFAEGFRRGLFGGSGSRVDFQRKFRLACCNKQIYNEALPLLFKIHSFKLDVWRIGRPRIQCFYNLEGIYLRFKEAPQDMLAIVTDMHIFLDEKCVEEDASSGNTLTIRIFAHISRACTGLRSLRLKTHQLARSMYPIWTGYRYSEETPPYRLAMVEVLRALARRVPYLEFQVREHFEVFEEFLDQVAPLEYWDTDRTRETARLKEPILGTEAINFEEPAMRKAPSIVTKALLMVKRKHF